MNDKEMIMQYLRKKYNRETLREDVLVYKIVHDSIEFIKLLSEIEDVIGKEVLLEEIEDITKLTVGDISKYV